MIQEDERPGSGSQRPEGTDDDSEAVVGLAGQQPASALTALDQIASELDQRSSDSDQAASDRDQSQADADQRISDRDQAAADRDHATQPASDKSNADYEASRVDRLRGTLERVEAGWARAQTATERHEQARLRDENARLRDLRADVRDRCRRRLNTGPPTPVEKWTTRVSSGGVLSLARSSSIGSGDEGWSVWSSGRRFGGCGSLRGWG